MARRVTDGTGRANGSSPARILVIDEQEANVRLLKDMLGESGYRTVFGITDARTVERMLPAYAPDLILLDLHMPHLDGHAVLKPLKAAESATATCQCSCSLPGQGYLLGRPMPVAELTTGTLGVAG